MCIDQVVLGPETDYVIMLVSLAAISPLAFLPSPPDTTCNIQSKMLVANLPLQYADATKMSQVHVKTSFITDSVELVALRFQPRLNRIDQVAASRMQVAVRSWWEAAV